MARHVHWETIDWYIKCYYLGRVSQITKVHNLYKALKRKSEGEQMRQEEILFIAYRVDYNIILDTFWYNSQIVFNKDMITYYEMR